MHHQSSIHDNFRTIQRETKPFVILPKIIHSIHLHFKERGENSQYLSEPARSTRFKHPNRKLIIESHSHCKHSTLMIIETSKHVDREGKDLINQ
jgi:hypothetical protein